MSSTTRRARLLSSAALVLPVLILCSPFLFGSRTLVGKDFHPGYGPFYDFARESWRRDGELPQWNPHHFAGIPFVGNPQVGLYYPPNALFLILPSSRAFEWLTFLHLLVAAAGTYRLARGLGAGRGGAVLAGLSYALSQSIFGRITAGHYPYFVNLCLAPLLLHLLRLLVDRPRPLHAAGLAAVGAGVLLGGSPQFIIQLGLLCAAMALWRILLLRRRGSPWRPAAGYIGAAMAVAIALACVHLIPALGLAAEASRTTSDSPAMIASFGDFDGGSLVGFLVPGFPWRPSAELWLWHEKALYAGILPLLLALVALLRDRDGGTRFFAAALGFSLLAAVGPSLPIHHLLGAIPFYGRFRVPERIVWIAVLSISILASRGWRACSEIAHRRNLLATAGVTSLAAVLLIAIGFRAPREAALLALTAAAAIAAVALRSRAAIGLAAVILALDLCGNSLARLPLSSPDRLSLVPWYASRIGPERAEFRLLDLTDQTGSATVEGFRLLRCGGYPIPGRLSEFYARAWRDAQPDLDTLPSGRDLKDVQILRSLNVKWIVSSEGPFHPDWRLVARGPTSTLYEDPGALPFASTSGGGSIDWRRPAAHRIEVVIRAERPGRIVLREMMFPGWRAWRDGTEIPILLEEGLMMAMEAPAGASTLRLTYRPPSRTISLWISSLGLVSLLGLLGQEVRVRRRAAAQPGPSTRPTGS